ncbi:MAG: tRNA (N6-isopentenyl adenosine(37)-C2)-methylthiotransferase MiaB [Chloroflexi bacterium]|nr:tRNA (N6-isopentenyl adenosine(37)-C2)-methylthiotransferase MiaB [Chloroflexota bacterium]MDA8186677.1 tRNA (N6-isopentenyl adenosine(37)-C2)-methylthiotransferase MiaB [Dehalococcoidales bacterium]
MLYHIWTVGCQMNKADSERIATALERLGLRPTSDKENADVIVLNSCSVRRSAEDRVLSKLGSLKPLKRARPEMIVALAGCMVGNDIASLREKLPFVDVFLKPQEGDELLRLVIERRSCSPPTFLSAVKDRSGDFEQADGIADCVEEDAQSTSDKLVSEPTRWVPIIYGCDNFCSYCIVPFRRGRERSRSPEDILAEIREMVQRGATEVTLLGQNVDSYGHDLPDKPDLADLLQLVDDVDGLYRVRFLTSHPKDMSDKLIDAVARLPKVCEYINLPVQSGDDTILKAMKRRYTVEEYRNLVRRIRTRIPDVSLSTDLIVGFPGETREQFESSYRLLEEIRFDAVHVAAYSPRPGTAAARLPDDVAAEEKKDRLQRVEELQERVATENNAALLGKIVQVLVEGKNKGKWQGRTRTNKLVFFQSDDNWLGRLALVAIEKTGPWSLQGSETGETRVERAQTPLSIGREGEG